MFLFLDCVTLLLWVRLVHSWMWGQSFININNSASAHLTYNELPCYWIEKLTHSVFDHLVEFRISLDRDAMRIRFDSQNIQFRFIASFSIISTATEPIKFSLTKARFTYYIILSLKIYHCKADYIVLLYLIKVFFNYLVDLLIQFSNILFNL